MASARSGSRRARTFFKTSRAKSLVFFRELLPLHQADLADLEQELGIIVRQGDGLPVFLEKALSSGGGDNAQVEQRLSELEMAEGRKRIRADGTPEIGDRKAQVRFRPGPGPEILESRFEQRLPELAGSAVVDGEARRSALQAGDLRLQVLGFPGSIDQVLVPEHGHVQDAPEDEGDERSDRFEVSHHASGCPGSLFRNATAMVTDSATEKSRALAGIWVLKSVRP